MVHLDQQAEVATLDSLELLETKVTLDLLEALDLEDGLDSLVFLASEASWDHGDLQAVLLVRITHFLYYTPAVTIDLTVFHSFHF